MEILSSAHSSRLSQPAGECFLRSWNTPVLIKGMEMCPPISLWWPFPSSMSVHEVWRYRSLPGLPQEAVESTQGGAAKVDLGCGMSEVPRMELLELKCCCCLLWGMPSCLQGLQ